MAPLRTISHPNSRHSPSDWQTWALPGFGPPHCLQLWRPDPGWLLPPDINGTTGSGTSPVFVLTSLFHTGRHDV